MQNRAKHGRPIRQGFTLVELLVVMSIIAVLVALSASALFRVFGSQNTANTRTLIQRLDSRLKQQTAFAADKFRKEAQKPGFSASFPTTMALAKQDQRRAIVIHAKRRFMQWFPTSFAEVFAGANFGTGTEYPPISTYVNYLNQYGITSGNSPPLPHESSACLYMALQFGPEGTPDSDLGVTSATKMIGGVPTLVDGWGQPLMFVRWPTGDLVAGGGGTGVSPVNLGGAQVGQFLDPLDPQGMLTAPNWLNSKHRTDFETLCHPVPNRSGNKAQSLNLAPVIVSSGSDKQFGLDPVPNPNLSLKVLVQSEANDNLYNR